MTTQREDAVPSPDDGSTSGPLPANTTACRACGQPTLPADTFCEACGAALVTAAPDGTEAVGAGPGLLPPPGAGAAATGGAGGASAGGASGASCERCGAAVDADDFCTGCGIRRARRSDHVEVDLGVIASVSDKGLHHHRNEDRAALELNGRRAGGVVCDGVSSSANPDRAAEAAASAAIAVLGEALALTSGVPADVLSVLQNAVARARQAAAAVEVTETTSPSAAPSTTLVAALAVPGLVAVANVGDSRAYWLSSGGLEQLSVDDSWAEAAIAAGMSTTDAHSSEKAHMITRWLGADSDQDPVSVVTHPVDCEGLLILCSDGLWNYFPSSAELAGLVKRIAPADPLRLAQGLADAALVAGGHDNVTVVVIPTGPDGVLPRPNGPHRTSENNTSEEQLSCQP